MLSDDGGLRKIFTSEVFNFPPNGFVKGDVVYKRERDRPSGSSLPDVDSILYFTDGVNEPRKLDIYRAIFGPIPSLDIADMPTDTPYKVHDVLCACPKVPMGNVDYVFAADPAKEVSNFENVPGVQFAIQGVYTDGSVTAIGPYSQIAFPPSLVNRGAAPSASLLNHNVCKIKIPDIQEDIETIKILYRYGNKATFRELAEVPNQQVSSFGDENWDQDLREYSFYNDQVSTGVSPSDVAKTFDNLPRQAKAQAAISNRLVFSNFKEGFDPYKPRVTTTVLFKKRPTEGIDFTVDIVPTIETTQSIGGQVTNKTMGFEVAVDQIPNDIPEDTTVTVAFSFSPDKNFHLYESRGAYHQSQHVGPVSGNFRGLPTKAYFDGKFGPNGNNNDYEIEDITAFVENSNSGVDQLVNNEEPIIPNGSPAHMLLNTGNGSQGFAGAWYSGQGSSKNTTSGQLTRGLKYDENFPDENQPNVNAVFGRNFGVGYRADNNSGADYPYKFTDGDGFRQSPRYKARLSGGGDFITRAGYGTSAGAPLIIQGTKLSFDLSFRITQDIENGREVVAKTIQDIMIGKQTPTYSAKVEILASNNKFLYNLDVGLTNGRKIYQSDVEKNLISMASHIGNTATTNMMNFDNILEVNKIDGVKNRRLPMHYFILNKAEVKFYFEEAIRPAAMTAARKAFQLSIASIKPDFTDGIYTCIKRPEPNVPWLCLSKDAIDSVLNGETTYSSVVVDYSDSIPNNDKLLDYTGITLGIESLEYGKDSQWRINERVMGRIFCDEMVEGGNGFPFYPCEVNVDSPNYVPGFNFRFSLLDGAGGPGGTPPGSQSAYGRYENNRFGSVAGQMIATFHGVHDEPIRSKLINMVPSIGYGFGEDANFNGEAPNGVRDIGVIGGVYGKNGNTVYTPDNQELENDQYGFASEISGGAPVRTILNNRVVNSGVPSQQDVIDEFNTNFFGDSDSTFVAYVLCGPFFTGSIALNPIATSPETPTGALNNLGNDDQGPLSGIFPDETNGYQFLNGSPINSDQRWCPPVWDQTTTMPYIFSGSTRPSVYSNGPGYYRTVFPFPILNGDLLEEIVTPGNVYDQVNSPLISDLYDIGSLPTESGWSANHPPFGSISWEDRPGHAEMGSVSTSISGATSKPIMSFKANANHEFGIIYYDERGRHGRVNHIGSVYVPGFSPAERNGLTDGGPAHIRIKFNSVAPDWAHYYKIAYSKNTSISKFFQYTAGGGFITPNENPIDSGLESAKIYVSLNYLQGHPISYSDSWGGRSQEGSPVVYQPKEGDKVRVISYQRSSEAQVEKVFAKNIVFDVIGIESLGETDNPLWAEADGDVPENRKGLFVTLRNNPENTGFSYADIEQDNHLWGNNCIIEIFRPIDDLGAEDRLYYEIGPTYRCGPSGVANLNRHLNHEGLDAPIEVVDGDVFFRKTAVNMREFQGGEFVDLIRSENVDVNGDGTVGGDEWVVVSEPNFKSIYTEALSATDLFKSDSTSIGRPNKIDNNEKEMQRIASLIHSDKDITKSSKVGYSSFNGTESNDKDLDVAHGEVDYIVNTDDSLLIIQKNKVGHVPVDRNLISTADNEPSLISSSEFLGTARYYAGRGGSDGHPESIAMANGNAYFAHKTDGKVFRASGANGLLEISNKGMKSFFRNLFSFVGKNDKIVGGYDPIKEEYLINVQVVESLTPQNGTPIDQEDTPGLTFNVEFLENASSTDNIIITTEGANDPGANIGEGEGGAGLGDSGPG